MAIFERLIGRRRVLQKKSKNKYKVTMHATNRKEYRTILAMSFGSLLEWYEVFLYVYWAPVISELFFVASSKLMSTFYSLLIFMIGFWARPLGGIFFGRIGDLLGRKYALILSITIMIFPTLGMGLLPTYEQIGILAPICFAILRLLQSLPVGGELPGAFCYFYECARPDRRRYMIGWGSVGSQLGMAISLVESKLMEHLFPSDVFLEWGWRISFIFGSFIALFGLYLRKGLHETPRYQEMVQRHQRLKISVFQIISQYRRAIGKSCAFNLFTPAGFYVSCVIFPVYLSNFFGLEKSSLFMGLSLLLLGAVSFPFFGFLGDHFSNKKMLMGSVICIIFILFPIYFSIIYSCKTLLMLLLLVFGVCLSILMTLMPYRFVVLFPTPVRFTGVGFSFNVVDAILGSIITVLVFYFINLYHSLLPGFLILFICAVISLLGLMTIDETKEESYTKYTETT